ncbi:hypothetical protein EOS_35705 [Caballeronia mineralivorans PML1(12)]|uniref:Transmembrane protein n=1 Tax=Caballeronia mineralivorans PML1(12) TaxID=908627 RepID=A0A0J1CL75_9BURK|nr:hypothetical protein [Caballeronia mineralivorans]KLU21515.1 hypothetical protein EOS_35705 [Caballeronia mineralivorans PML1(12)]
MTYAAEISELKSHVVVTSSDNASKVGTFQECGIPHLVQHSNGGIFDLRTLFNAEFSGACAEFRKTQTSSSADVDCRKNADGLHPDAANKLHLDTVAKQTPNPFNITLAVKSSSRMSAVLLSIFAPWTGVAGSNAVVQCATLGAEAAGSALPFVADIGLAIGYSSSICAVAETATVIHDVRKIVLDQVKANRDKQQNQAGYENFKHGNKSVPPSKADSPPASDPTREASSLPIEPQPLSPPMTAEQKQQLIEDASAHLRYENANGRSNALRWEWLKIGIAFIRDCALQLAAVANRAAITAKILDSAVSVSANVAGVFASAFSIATSLFHAAAGIVDLIHAHLTRERAVHAGDEMKACMDDDKQVLDLEKLGDRADLDGEGMINEAKAKKQKDAIHEVQNPKELKDVNGVHSLISNHFLKNQSQAVSETKTVRWRAGVRVLYGVLGASVAIAGLALSATGVGGVIVVGAISAAGAVLGMLWLGFAVYKTYANWKAGREKHEREENEKPAAIASSDQPLAFAESEFLNNSSLQANGHIAATLLARHLAGGKEAAAQDALERQEQIRHALANANAKPAQSSTETTAVFEATNQIGHSGVPISAEGLKLRRKTATRVLLKTGMSREQVSRLKTLTRDESKAPEVLEEIKGYLLGNAARERSARPPKERKGLRQRLTDATRQVPILRARPA